MNSEESLSSEPVYHHFNVETLEYLSSIQDRESDSANFIEAIVNSTAEYLNSYFGFLGFESKISEESCRNIMLIDENCLDGVKNKSDRTILEKYDQLQFIDHRDGTQKTLVINRDYYSHLYDYIQEVVDSVNENWNDDTEAKVLFNRWCLCRLTMWALLDTVRVSNIKKDLSTQITGWLSSLVLDKNIGDRTLYKTDLYLRNAYPHFPFSFNHINVLINDEDLGQETLRLYLGEDLENAQNKKDISRHIF